MPRLRAVWVLYRMELRGALRDRMIVTYSLLVPALLYPLILWLTLLGFTFALGQAEALTSRVVVSGWPQAHPRLRRQIEAIPGVTVAGAPVGAGAAERITRGDLDALLELVPAEGAAAALANNFVANITFDKSKDRSVTARERLVDALDSYREKWLAREAKAHGIDDAAWQVFTLKERNVASRKQIGAHLLSLLLPLIFTVMVVIGCFYPAVDATAGERERGTWETLMAAPASRASIVVAKYLYVTTFGLVAGLINFAAMAVTFKPIIGQLLDRAGETLEITLRPAAVPIVVLGALLLAGFAAAGMMLFASFAKTFKDGQSLITPFYLLTFLPMLFLQGPGVRLDLHTAVVPVANVMLMVRDAIMGSLAYSAAALALLASLAFIAVLVSLAVFVLRYEDVVVGSYQGTLVTLLKTRLHRGGRSRTRGGGLHE